MWGLMGRFMDATEATIGHDNTVFLCGALSVVFLWVGLKFQAMTIRNIKESAQNARQKGGTK